jgi:hypothetical protein
MHTFLATTTGILLLGLFIFVGGTPRREVFYTFVGVWTVLSIAHFLYGVVVGGYGVLEELKIHAIVCGVPALAAVGAFLRSK